MGNVAFDNDETRDPGHSEEDKKGNAARAAHKEEEREQNLSPEVNESRDISPDVKETLSPEEEWAEALKINFTPPPVPGTTPPPIPQQNPENTDNLNLSRPPQLPDNEGDNESSSNEAKINFTSTGENNPQNEPMPSTYLIWSILSTVFCCFIPGIVAIIFSSQVSSKYYAGDLKGARRASRIAEIWIIVSFVLGVLSATLYLPFMLISV